MTTASLNWYNKAKKNKNTVMNLASDTFKVLLTTSSYTPSQTTHEVLADVTNEVSGNGYARQTLGSVTFNESAGTVTFDAADPVFTASGGSITGRYFVIYNDTVASPTKPLLFYGLLDTTPADVVTTDGNTLTLVFDAAGIFTEA